MGNPRELWRAAGQVTFFWEEGPASEAVACKHRENAVWYFEVVLNRFTEISLSYDKLQCMRVPVPPQPCRPSAWSGFLPLAVPGV